MIATYITNVSFLLCQIYIINKYCQELKHFFDMAISIIIIRFCMVFICIIHCYKSFLVPL